MAVSLIVLAVLAYLGRSLVMLASVGGMAVALWMASARPLRVQLAALVLGGIGASFAAEAVHVVHHVLVQDQPDHGGFWMSAFLVGLIDVVVMAPIVVWTGRGRRVPGGSASVAPSG